MVPRSRREQLFYGFAAVMYLLIALVVGESAPLALIPLALGHLGLAVSRRSAAPGAGVRAAEGGTVFPLVPRATVPLLFGYVAVVIGAGTALIVADDMEPVPAWAVRALAVLFLIPFLPAALLALFHRAKYVTFTPEAVRVAARGRGLHVPWDALAEVVDADIRGRRMLGLRLAHDEGVSAPASMRFARPLNRPFGADYFLDPSVLDADPDGFVRLAQHMHAHPEDRARLADPGGAAVVAAPSAA